MVLVGLGGFDCVVVILWFGVRFVWGVLLVVSALYWFVFLAV